MQQVWYHTSDIDSINIINSLGLVVGKKTGGFSNVSWADKFYGIRPIYLSQYPWAQNYPGKFTIEVNVSGLQLWPDLPSLVDSGAEPTLHGKLIWDNATPSGPRWARFKELLINRNARLEVQISDLLSDKELALAAIDLTGTAVVMNDISPERISFDRDDFIAAYKKRYFKSNF